MSRYVCVCVVTSSPAILCKVHRSEVTKVLCTVIWYVHARQARQETSRACLLKWTCWLFGMKGLVVPFCRVKASQKNLETSLFAILWRGDDDFGSLKGPGWITILKMFSSPIPCGTVRRCLSHAMAVMSITCVHEVC